MVDVAVKRADIARWIDAARSNPVEYRRRQAVDVILAAIGRDPRLQEFLYLKGGTLMNLAYGSPRTTKDVDFTVTEDKTGYAETFVDRLDEGAAISAALLGYPGLVCRVQSRRMNPKGEPASWPTLRVRVGFAQAGTHQAELLRKRQAVDVVLLDISFNETVVEAESLVLSDNGTTIRTYALHELIAEKLRAILQQPVRGRNRGQDIYDIARLVRDIPLVAEDRKDILNILMIKSADRKLVIHRDDILDPAISEHARSRYESLTLEIDEELDFARDLGAIRELYRALPWED